MDFNGDGRNDVISGSYSPGYLYLFAQQPDGSFAAGEIIKDKEGKPIKVGYASHVCAADWDSDGDLDLVIGNISGEVYYVSNEGNAKENAFGTPEKLRTISQEIRVQGDAGPVLADWDGDGRLDLLVGAGDGSVNFFRNIGTEKQPRLADPQVLVPAGSTFGDGSRSGLRTKICVADWNDDGLVDLLVGDFNMTNAPEPQLTEEQKAERDRVIKEYEAAVQEYIQASEKFGLQKLVQEYVRLQEAPENESAEAAKERQTKLEELLKQINQLQEKELKPFIEKLGELQAKLPIRYEHHGFVWLFLRRAAVKP